ncbi:MAG: PilZ domain-containing protein, partial [Sphingomicrobium sp.]
VSAQDPTENPAESGSPPRPPRRLIALAAHVLRGDDKVADASVLDMSYEGCRVRTEDYLWPGEQVKLSVPRRGVINATVQWSAEGQAGLIFDDSDKDPAEVAKVPRRALRFPADSQVSLRRLSNLKFHVKVRDISPDGCRIDLVERPAVGETLHLKFEGLDVLECTVRWVDGYIAGLEYARPIHPAVFDLLMLRLKIRG